TGRRHRGSLPSAEAGRCARQPGLLSSGSGVASVPLSRLSLRPGCVLGDGTPPTRAHLHVYSRLATKFSVCDRLHNLPQQDAFRPNRRAHLPAGWHFGSLGEEGRSSKTRYTINPPCTSAAALPSCWSLWSVSTRLPRRPETVPLWRPIASISPRSVQSDHKAGLRANPASKPTGGGPISAQIAAGWAALAKVGNAGRTIWTD